MSGKVEIGGTQWTDTAGVENNNGLFNDGSGYGVNSASDMANGNQFLDEFLDPTGFVKGFYNDLMGFTSQEREFEQQMKMTQYENNWNSAQQQMMRAKEAGINPLTAAAGISGGGTGQVAPSGGSATPNSALADTVSKLGLMSGQAGLAGAQAKSISDKLSHEIKNIDSDTYKKLTEGGLNQWSAKSIQETLPLTTRNMRADYYQKLANIEKTWQEYENLVAQHDNIVEELNLIIQNENTLYSEQEVNEARKRLIDEQTRWQKTDNDFWESAGYRRDDSVHQAIIHSKTNGKDPSFIGDVISEYESNVTQAEEHAKAKESWNYRPSTPAEAAAYIGSTIGASLRSVFDAHKGDVAGFFSDLRANASASREFDEAFEDYRHELREQYINARNKYNEYKHSGASDMYIGQLQKAKDDAYKQWKSANKLEFANKMLSEKFNDAVSE